MQLVQLQKDLKQFADAGVQVVGVSYDSVAELAAFAARKKITFPLLSDPDSKVIRAYELLNKEAKGKAAGVPYPGTLVVDRAGVLRAKLFVDGYARRHTTAELLKAAAGLKK